MPVPVTTVAKWKTTAQLVALGFLIAGPAGEAVLPGALAIGIGLLWVAAILTLYTGWDYMKASYDHVGDASAMKAVYFAWVRERIGKSEEEIAPPADIATVGDLIGWLSRAARTMPTPSRRRPSSAPRSTGRMSSTTRRSPARARSPSSRR